MPKGIETYLDERRTLVEKALEKVMPQPTGLAGEVITSMNYSLFAGGKRLRPILCLAGVEALGGNERHALPVACALPAW